MKQARLKLDDGRPGALLLPTGSAPRFIFGAAIDAAAADAVELDLRGFPEGRVELLFAGTDCRFDAAKRIALPATAPGEEGSTTYRFPVSELEGWNGPIGRMRLSFFAPEPRPMRLMSLRLVKEQRPTLRSLPRQPFKVFLGGQARTAVVVFPGQDTTVHLKGQERQEGSRLTFALGLRKEARRRAVVTVSLADGTKLLRKRLDGDRRDGRDRWYEERLLLPNGTSSIAFSATVEGPGTSPGPNDLPLLCSVTVSGSTDFPPKGVFLVSIDTLRADRLSAYGNPTPTTPFLDRRSRRSAALFSRCMASAPWTIPSHASIFTGLDAIRHGINTRRRLPKGLRTLAETMRRQGYTTVAVTGGGYVHPRYGFSQGFDLYEAIYRWKAPRREITREVDRMVRDVRRCRHLPLFAFFHTYQVHDPMRSIEPYRRLTGVPAGVVARVSGRARNPDGTRSPRWVERDEQSERRLPAKLVKGVYDSNLALVDQQLERLQRMVAKMRPGADLVVITSDHGQMLTEHGLAGHAFLYDENLLVPLLIQDRGRSRGALVREQVRLVDLAPTILDLAEEPQMSDIDGRSLAPLLHQRDIEHHLRRGLRRGRARPAVSYVSVGEFQGISLVDRAQKVVYRQGRWPPRALLYNLVRDPAERQPHPLRGTRNRLAAILAKLLQEYTTGLRLTLTAKTRPLVLRLLAPGLSPSRIESLDFAPPALEATSRGLLFRLKQGRIAHLLVAGAPGPELDFSLDLASSAGEAIRTRIDFSNPGASPSVSVDASGVRFGTEPPSDGVFFDYRKPPMESQDPQMGEGLARSLRELGYLE